MIFKFVIHGLHICKTCIVLVELECIFAFGMMHRVGWNLYKLLLVV